MKHIEPMYLTERQKKVVKAYADHNMSMAATARGLNCHQHTVKYHLREVHRKTGLEPYHFYDLVKLLVRIHDEPEEKKGGTLYGRKRKI